MIINNVWHTLTLFYTQDKIDVCVNTTKVGTYTLSKTNEIKHINKYDNLNRLVAKEIKTDTKTFNQSYTYDKYGRLLTSNYNEKNKYTYGNNIYFYVKDLLGVIHKIVDVNGNTVVQYLYDG